MINYFGRYIFSCGTTFPSSADAKGKVVAGPNVFICRNCVETTVEIFCENDPEWGRLLIEMIPELVKGAQSGKEET